MTKEERGNDEAESAGMATNNENDPFHVTPAKAGV
jgi:hypothetical protein